MTEKSTGFNTPTILVFPKNSARFLATVSLLSEWNIDINKW